MKPSQETCLKSKTSPSVADMPTIAQHYQEDVLGRIPGFSHE